MTPPETPPERSPEPDLPVAFRRLTRADLPLLQRWFREEHVRRWWQVADSTLAGLEAKYGPRIDGGTPVDPFVILYDALAIGYIQLYSLRDFPAHSAALGVGAAAAGIDIAIGDPAYIFRGLGPHILRAFVHQIVFARPEVDLCTIDPSIHNTAAIRAYEKAGFTYLRTVHLPGEPDPSYIMTLPRPAP